MSILAGAIVRGTGSGSGCGSSWPTCNGNIIPEFIDTPTIIEYTHRVLSGALLIVTLLVFFCSRKLSLDRVLTRVINLLLLFVIIEALIGMVIVSLEWVALNTSLPRLFAVPIHLVNTFFLLALYVVTYCLISSQLTDLNFYLNKRFILSCFLFFLVAASGSIAALSDFLYPSESFTQGLVMDFTDSSRLLTRLRVLHPVVATALIFWIFSEGRRLFVQEKILSAAYLITLTLIVASIGVINVITNINIIMSISHLFFADLLWGLYIYSNMDKTYNSKKVNI
jgi:heme A synthase